MKVKHVKKLKWLLKTPLKAKQIFEHIGFKEVRAVRKNRDYYSYENFEISLDDVED